MPNADQVYREYRSRLLAFIQQRVLPASLQRSTTIAYERSWSEWGNREDLLITRPSGKD